MRIILLRQRQFWQRMHVQPERLYLCFVLGIIYGDRCDRKHPKQLFIQVKPLFFVVEFSNTVTFCRNLILSSY